MGPNSAAPHARRREGTAYSMNGRNISCVVIVPSKSNKARFMTLPGRLPWRAPHRPRAGRRRQVYSGRRLRISQAQSRHIAQRRRTETATVFATELRRTFITHAMRRRGDVALIRQQHATRLVEAQLLLVLQRTHGGDGAKMMVQR